MVVPTYNERDNIRPLVEGVKKTGVEGLGLLFVDDSSPDGTSDEIRAIAGEERWVSLLTRDEKRGLGSAYQEGFGRALATTDSEVVVEMDADLQHPPSTISQLVEAVMGGADVAVASRYIQGGSVEGWSTWRRVVSKGANAYARRMLGLGVRDATSGFRAYSRAAAQKICDAELPAKGFEFQVASLLVLKTGMKTVEVPLVFAPRKSGKSKLGVSDMGRFFIAVIRLALSKPKVQ